VRGDDSRYQLHTLKFSLFIAHVSRIAKSEELRRYWFLIIAVPLVLAGLDTLARVADHLGYIQDSIKNEFSVSKDHGIAELVGYCEMMAATVLTIMAGNRLDDKKLKVVAGVIFFLLCDDLFLLHDQMREKIGPILFANFAYEKQTEYGELVYFALAIVAIATILALAYRTAARIELFHASILIVAFASFAFFAVIVDAAGSLLIAFGLIDSSFYRRIELLENSGELLATGFILMAALVLFRMGQKAGANP
jgi:hypothetical protein